MYFTRGMAKRVESNFSGLEWDDEAGEVWASICSDFWRDHWTMQQSLEYDVQRLTSLHPYLIDHWMPNILWWLQEWKETVDLDKFNWVFESLRSAPLLNPS